MKYGVIQEWPKGFFDEYYDHAEKLTIATARKRKLVREGKNRKIAFNYQSLQLELLFRMIIVLRQRQLVLQKHY